MRLVLLQDYKHMQCNATYFLFLVAWRIVDGVEIQPTIVLIFAAAYCDQAARRAVVN